MTANITFLHSLFLTRQKLEADIWACTFYQQPAHIKPALHMYFDFIKCFTTTFLRTHSWLNWVDEDDDEDEVGLKEKPEDPRYIKKITSK